MASAPEGYSSSLIASLRGGGAPSSSQGINVPGVQFFSPAGSQQSGPSDFGSFTGNLNPSVENYMNALRYQQSSGGNLNQIPTPELIQKAAQAPAPETPSTGNIMPAPVIEPPAPYVPPPPPVAAPQEPAPITKEDNEGNVMYWSDTANDGDGGWVSKDRYYGTYDDSGD